MSKVLGRWGVVCWLALCVWALAGCGSEQQFTELPGIGGSAATTGTSTSPGTPVNARSIQIGDALRVTFSDMPVPLPPMDVTVREDGKITLLQQHDFVAAHKTRGQLANEIHAFYVPNYYPTMTVSVDWVPNTQFYYVGGEVRSPGRQVYIGTIHVLGAIKSAGDFSDFANKRKVKLTRADGHILIINCNKALEDPSLDPEVFPGDVVHVPRRGPLW